MGWPDLRACTHVHTRFWALLNRGRLGSTPGGCSISSPTRTLAVECRNVAAACCLCWGVRGCFPTGTGPPAASCTAAWNHTQTPLGLLADGSLTSCWAADEPSSPRWQKYAFLLLLAGLLATLKSPARRSYFRLELQLTIHSTDLFTP